MPKGKRPQSDATETNESTAPSGSPTVNLSAYRQASAKAPSPSANEQAEREKRPRVKWEDLVGISGLTYLDGWTDTNEDYGDYTGSVVRVPAVGKNPAVEVVVLTGKATNAGKGVAHYLGQQAQFDAKGKMIPVGISVTARPSPNYPEGHPRVTVAFEPA